MNRKLRRGLLIALALVLVIPLLLFARHYIGAGEDRVEGPAPRGCGALRGPSPRRRAILRAPRR